MMRTKWIVASALMGFGGLALAGDSQAEREAQEEGEEVRTSMERGADQTEDAIDERTQEAQKRAGEIGERASEGAEEAGSGMAASIDEATDAVQGEPSTFARGSLEEGRVNNTLTTNAFGYFTGTGLNATYQRPISDKFSAVGGASFSRTSQGAGAATRFGLQAGVDYFILGQHNEGLRIGPRVETAFGGETAGENSAFGSLSAAAELGYNWISARGLTAGLGAGVAAGFGGTSDNGTGEPKSEDVDNLNAGVLPYARLNVGFSW
ncbi:MAG: hypothetical protein M3Y59_24330 [Myxococcota bacterium]|nr:hypothetical protein [Myxococcota bacterium]